MIVLFSISKTHLFLKDFNFRKLNKCLLKMISLIFLTLKTLIILSKDGLSNYLSLIHHI